MRMPVGFLCAVFTVCSLLAIDDLPAYNLSVTVKGGGTVSSLPSGTISCTSAAPAGTCSADPAASSLLLVATPTSDTFFGGWGGSCSLCYDTTCRVVLDADRSCVATFTDASPVMIGGTSAAYAPYLQAAFDTADGGSAILARELYFPESVIMSRPVTLLLRGGYDTSFSTRSGYSFVRKVTLRAGKVVTDKIVVAGLADAAPPTVPAALRVTAQSSSKVDLVWAPSSDNVGIAGYEVYRGGTKVGTTTGTSFSDTSVAANTGYCYTVAAFDGAGNDSGQSSPACVNTPVVSSQVCIGCHDSALSAVTGTAVVGEWSASAHSSAPGGAGCDNCHHVVDGHTAGAVLPPLPSDTVCVTCHTATVAMSTAQAHFSNFSASYNGFPLSGVALTLANPVTGTHSSSCNGCHNPHDPTTFLPVNREWAKSGHAAATDDPFREAYIEITTCNRCHSTTGFRYFATHGQTAVSQAQLGRYSSAKEVIGCPACHTDYSWKRLSSDPGTIFARYSTPYLRFANVTKRIPGSSNPSLPIGDSNLCVPCHGGRSARSGASIMRPATTANAAAPFDSHYLPAAAVMYGKIGFIDFTSQGAVLPAVPPSAWPTPTSAIPATTYGRTLITSDEILGGVTSIHRKLGTTAINGDTHDATFFVPGVLDSGGPCVVCHMKGGHSMKIEAQTFSTVCSHCHSSDRGTPLNGDNFAAVLLGENRAQMFDALALAVSVLESNYDITLSLSEADAIARPLEVSFMQKSTGFPLGGAAWRAYVTDGPGATLTPAEVYKLKGALYNILLCYRDQGAYLHARTLTRRLIYDSIDFLDDGQMNQSVGATAQVKSAEGTPETNRVFGRFMKGMTAYADLMSMTLAPGTTASMTYLLGFDRSTGAWTPPQRERP